VSLTNTSSDAKTQVLQAVDVVELIGHAVKLKRRGKDYVGLCPFHQEKTPSFHVKPDKQFFICYGCKAAGNAIDFVIRRDRVEFIEALKILAKHAGIDLPRFGGSKEKTGERQLLLEAHSTAATLFEKLLGHPQDGKAARDYLRARGFADETLRRFRIGLAPDSWDWLLKHEAMKKFAPSLLQQAGLVKPRENGTGHYDTFRNRIIFPIRDESGRIIAFGGRVMPGSEDPAKYLNSPETPLFSKSKSIFGLDLARQSIVESRTVAIVEGYTDVLMAHQHGATNVVSILGTALTEQHVATLRRFADRIVLLFDPDTAGEAAVNRAVELFLTQPVEIAIGAVPDGLDPDEFLIKNGPEGLKNVLEASQDALTYTWKRLVRELGAQSSLTGQKNAVTRYLEVLAAARGSGPIDPIRWGASLTRVSRLTEIPVQELHRRFKMKRPQQRQARSNGPAGEAAAPPSIPGFENADARAEKWLLGVLLAEPQRWHDVQQHVAPQDLTDEQRVHLAELYWQHQRDEGEPIFNEFLGALESPELRALAVELVDAIEQLDTEQALRDAIAHLAQVKRRRNEMELMAQLRRTSVQTSEDEQIQLLKQLQEQVRQPDLRRINSSSGS
jgi:DNA primase